MICHEIEKPYIQGEKPLIKINLEQIKRMMQFMPENACGEYERVIENPPKAKVDVTVTDGQELPFCGGITVIFTPGHTPGHIGLYHQPSKTLVAGDSLNIADGKLNGPRPRNTPDMELAFASLKKYQRFEIKTVVCYHGGVFSGGANRRIDEIIENGR